MRPLLLCLGFCLLLSCKGRKCGNLICMDDFPVLKLSGFTYYNELDSILVIYHSNPQDTLKTSGEMITRSNNWKLKDPIDMSRDVTVIIGQAGHRYDLTNFKYEMLQCEEDCRTSPDYKVFRGCEINGQFFSAPVYLSK